MSTLADTSKNVQTQDASRRNLRRLQREIEDLRRKNARQEKSMAYLKKIIAQLEESITREYDLWKSRDGASGKDADGNGMLHRIEVFDEIIGNKTKIYRATLKDKEKFQFMLVYAKEYMKHSDQMPLFRDDDSRKSDPGNRCKLHLRHALLMALMHKKDNITQGVLGAVFGIDQAAVSRYLKVTDAMLEGTLPTANSVSEEISAAPTKKEFKKIVPGPDGGKIFADGTHCPIQRPAERTVRRMKYSGKKKKFTNTNVYANENGVIIGISKSTVGSVGDITLLKERPMPFGRWEEAMHDPDLPEAQRCHVLVDRGYQGIEKHLPGITPEIPHKKTKKSPLTPEQREHNHRIHSERVLVEHSIGRLKRYARLADPYDGTAAQFNREFNVITGLVNLDLLWDCMQKGPPPPGRWRMQVDWDRACSQEPAK